VTSGTDHFTKLSITTQNAVRIYREDVANPNKNYSDWIQKPFTRLEIIDQNPIQCLVQAEGRRGYCKIVIKGKIPNELKLFVSEIIQDPSEENCTWNFTRPRNVQFHLKDTRSAQANYKGKFSNNDGS